MVKAALPPMALQLDFDRLEKAARRTFGEEDREKIMLATQVFLTLVCGEKSLTWREWERVPTKSLRYYLDRPRVRPPRGPRGYPELSELIRFLRHHFPGIGKYTFKYYEEAGKRYSGRLVELVLELVKQINRQGAGPSGTFPADVGRYIKHVLDNS